MRIFINANIYKKKLCAKKGIMKIIDLIIFLLFTDLWENVRLIF
jgi:hypothetical protein